MLNFDKIQTVKCIAKRTNEKVVSDVLYAHVRDSTYVKMIYNKTKDIFVFRTVFRSINKKKVLFCTDVLGLDQPAIVAYCDSNTKTIHIKQIRSLNQYVPLKEIIDFIQFYKPDYYYPFKDYINEETPMCYFQRCLNKKWTNKFTNPDKAYKFIFGKDNSRILKGALFNKNLTINDMKILRAFKSKWNRGEKELFVSGLLANNSNLGLMLEVIAEQSLNFMSLIPMFQSLNLTPKHILTLLQCTKCRCNRMFACHTMYDTHRMYYKLINKPTKVPVLSCAQLHDYIMRMYNEQEDLIEAKKNIITYTEKILYIFDNIQVGDYVLKLPQTRSMLKMWGRKLHNCVGSYADKIQENGTLVLGIFKDEEIIGALEYRNAQIAQCKTYNNQDLRDFDKQYFYNIIDINQHDWAYKK